MVKASGLDFVMLDLEHGSYALETLADMATAGRGHGLPVLSEAQKAINQFLVHRHPEFLHGVPVTA